MTKYWVFLAIAIVAEVAATSALKLSDGMTKWVPTLFVIVGYGVAFYCLAQAIQAIPVGISYAVWAGVGIVLIALLGWVMFGQKLDIAAMLGIAFIITGVVLITLVSKSAN
ncbi:DMT family transporter [Alteromonas antoniana]|uniref:DMT family transporter n=1 Tax=Alteromonas antoniana TaxID=2803813 RepID=UPI001C492481|nr:multidrug efflux SMR transporter [Alteromonas antoniana]